MVARTQKTAEKGDIVVAGIPGEEGTVKTFNRKGDKVVLEPANERLAPMEFDPSDVHDLRPSGHRHAPHLGTGRGATTPKPAQSLAMACL